MSTHVLKVQGKTIPGSYCTALGKHVPNSSGQKRSDLEIKNVNVAETANHIIDIAMVHNFQGSAADVDDDEFLLF